MSPARKLLIVFLAASLLDGAAYAPIFYALPALYRAASHAGGAYGTRLGRRLRGRLQTLERISAHGF